MKIVMHHRNIGLYKKNHANIGPSTKDTSERKDKRSEQVTFSCSICGKFSAYLKKHKLSKHKEMTTDVTRNIEARNLTRHKDNNNEKLFKMYL